VGEEIQEKGKKDKDGADGWGPHVSGCGGVAVLSGLAGRVGPTGLGGLRRRRTRGKARGGLEDLVN
jgi:hypothetical protein